MFRAGLLLLISIMPSKNSVHILIDTLLEMFHAFNDFEHILK